MVPALASPGQSLRGRWRGRQTRRLNLDYVKYFFQEHFAYVPDNLEDYFRQVCYESSSAPGQKVVDIVRFLKLVYWILCPEAKFDRNSYAPRKSGRDPNQYTISNTEGSAASERPKRISPVHLSPDSNVAILGLAMRCMRAVAMGWRKSVLWRRKWVLTGRLAGDQLQIHEGEEAR